MCGDISLPIKSDSFRETPVSLLWAAAGDNILCSALKLSWAHRLYIKDGSSHHHLLDNKCALWNLNLTLWIIISLDFRNQRSQVHGGSVVGTKEHGTIFLSGANRRQNVHINFLLFSLLFTTANWDDRLIMKTFTEALLATTKNTSCVSDQKPPPFKHLPIQRHYNHANLQQVDN